MNGNRMKYASTPTFGLQKRNGLNKKPFQQQRVPEAPDFTKAPDAVPGMPSSAFFTIPNQPVGGMPSMPFSAQQASPYFPQGMSVPPIQSIPTPYPMSAYPAGNGYGAQGATSYPPQGYNQPFAPAMQPAQAANGMGNPPPLGNGAQAQPSQSGFSPRSQGFVPPTAAQGGGMNAMPTMNPMLSGGSPAPTVQPAAFMSGAPLPNAAPYGGMPMMGGMPVQNASFPADNQAAYFAQPNTMAFQPAQPVAAPPAYGQPAAAPKQHAPLDADKFWTIFLFGLLPLLFIPCIFVPQSLNPLRYLFLVLCVCGMGGMWYRQMYSSATRMIISVVYVALCIVTVSMLMQGGRDIQQTSAGMASPQATQAPVDEALAPAAAAVSATPQPAATPAGKSEAQMRLETFMSNWAGNRVEDMVNLVQPSWASAQDTPTNRLFQLLTNRTPVDYTIEDISGTDDDTSRTVTMTATIDKNNGKDPTMYRFMVLMVKEGGEWYVDPNSLATNDAVKTEDVVVNDISSDTGIATEAPRTTVSPAPAGSTVLYYNPDGGSYYHMDPNCASIKEEYRPLQGSFLYSELKSHSDLKPCLKCGAPTTALSDEALAAGN